MPLQTFIRRCLAYHKEDRVDVLQLTREPYLMPAIRKTLGGAAAANAGAPPAAPAPFPSTSGGYGNSASN